MNRQLIWKEWRDHRAALLALWAGIPLMLVAFMWTTYSSLMYAGDSHRITGILGMASVLVLIGFATFSGEWRRGHGAFLARLPGGLTRSFAIKMLFLTVMLIATGFWASGWTNLLFGTPAWRGPDTWIPGNAGLALVLVPTFMCILAVSASLLQPGFALVGGPVLAGLLTFPFWQAVQHEFLENSARSQVIEAGFPPVFPFANVPPAVQAGIGLLACLAGATIGIWVAFTRFKSMRGNRSSLVAIGMLLAGCAPAWAGWGYGNWQVHHVNPGSDYFAISEVFVGESGQFAFMNTTTRFFDEYYTGQRPIRVDLTTGEFEIIGDLGTKVASPRVHAARNRHLPSFPFSKTVTRVDSFGTSKVRHWDLESGKQTEHAVKLSTPWPMPEASEIGLAQGTGLTSPSGTGWIQTGTDQFDTYWDPSRNRLITLPYAKKYSQVLVLPGPWLVKIRTDSDVQGDWMRFDPETGEFSTDPHLGPGDRHGPCLTDGRILFLINHQLALYDPRAGEPQPIAHLGEAPETAASIMGLSAWLNRVLDPTEPILLGRVSDEYEYHFACSVNLQDMTAHWRPVTWMWKSYLVASIEPGCGIFLRDNCQLIRINFVTGERTVLFPKGEELKP
ncbi:MAG: hypothetical protein JKY61_07225 [Planctomycetes bacterium]|nr:hypothetical protein [Planctomycetota bacterium]